MGMKRYISANQWCKFRVSYKWSTCTAATRDNTTCNISILIVQYAACHEEGQIVSCELSSYRFSTKSSLNRLFISLTSPWMVVQCYRSRKTCSVIPMFVNINITLSHTVCYQNPQPYREVAINVMDSLQHQWPASSILLSTTTCYLPSMVRQELQAWRGISLSDIPGLVTIEYSVNGPQSPTRNGYPTMLQVSKPTSRINSSLSHNSCSRMKQLDCNTISASIRPSGAEKGTSH